MKKIIFLAVLISLPIMSFARTPVVGNMWNVSDYNGVYGAELNTNGQLNPMTSGLGCLGSSTYKWDIVAEDAAIDTLTINTSLVATEIMAKCDSWDNLVAKSTYCISGITGFSITTATCVSDKYYRVQSDFTQVAGVPRNLTVNFAGGGSSSGTIVIEGLDARGNRITESIAVCERTLPTAGSKAFSLVYGSTLSITTGADATITMYIGDSDKIGLMGDIDATTDVYTAKVRTSTTWASELSSLTVDATYDTWTHSDVPDGADDYMIFYRANSE